MLVLRRRHLEQLPGALLRHRPAHQPHIRDRPRPLPPRLSEVDDEAANVYLPSSNVGGLLERWHRFPQRPGVGRLAGFLSGVVRTMQNRVDTALTRQPGYRDRIVHVNADASEGGMNLTMPPEVIAALTQRGKEAARKLVQRFAETPGTDGGLSWDNHRWVRYRATMAAIGELVEEMTAAWTEPTQPGERTYEELALREDDVGPNAYRFDRVAQRALALELSNRLIEAGALLATSVEKLEENAPHPLARARIAPRE